MHRRTLGLVIPALEPTTGLLPVGRYTCAGQEVEDCFVTAAQFSASGTRGDIWGDWQIAQQFLQQSVIVHAAWLGGSFTTAKVDPDDIDVTFVVSADDYSARPPQDQQVVDLFNTPGHVKAVLGLKVDSYVLPWHRIPALPTMPVHLEYYRARGYWDDWWQRSPIAGKGNPPTPADAVPRRGYLEVLLSGYS